MVLEGNMKELKCEKGEIMKHESSKQDEKEAEILKIAGMLRPNL